MTSQPKQSQDSRAHMDRRKLVKGAGALVGASWLAADSDTRATASGARAANARGASAQEQIELTIWTAFPELDTFLSEVGPKYSEVKPNVKVVNTLFPQRALEQKVAASLPADQGPDLLELDRFELYPYYVNGEVLPITGETAEYITANWPEAATRDSISSTGELFTLPWVAGPKMMYYNVQMFEEAGITETPETVEEMMQMAEQLTKRDNDGNIITQGIDLRVSGGGAGLSQKFWNQVLIPYGAPVLVEEGEQYRAGYGNEAGASALALYLDALYVSNVSTFDAKHDAEGFGLGQAAMFQRESWVVDYLAQNAPDIEYDVFPMPKGPGGWGTVNNTLGLSLTSSSEHPEEALEFMRWLTNEENSAALYAISGWQPWRTEGVDFGDLFERKPVLEEFIRVLSLEGHRLYDYRNIGPVSEIHNRLADRLVSAFKDESLAGDPEAQLEAVKEMAEETNRILQDWGLFEQ